MSGATTEECTICFEQVIPDDFFILRCCKEKKICSKCLDCLRVPLCPYCRKIIPGLENDPKYRLCISCPESSFYGQERMMIDPRFLQSRILRRRLRRFRRLQMRGLL